jgi:hypothetical protein
MDKIVGQFEELIEELLEQPKIMVHGKKYTVYIGKKRCIKCGLKVRCFVINHSEYHLCKDCINDFFDG